MQPHKPQRETGTHSSQQTLGFLNGTVTAEETDHHNHSTDSDQNVDI